MKFHELMGTVGIVFICVVVMILVFDIGTAHNTYVVGWDMVLVGVFMIGFPFVCGYLAGRGDRT